MEIEEHTNIHSMCDECWIQIGDDREPKRILGGLDETCCWCRKTHRSDIWIREKKELVPIHNSTLLGGS